MYELFHFLYTLVIYVYITNAALFLTHSVHIFLVNDQTCAGDNLTFFCNATNPEDRLLWRLTLPVNSDFRGTSGAFGATLNRDFSRITSTDDVNGPNPTIITILNVTAADNGVVVQCRNLDDVSSTEISLYIGKLDCECR